MPRPMHSVNVMLSPADRDAADLLAAKWDMSRSAVMRRLIRSGADHVLNHRPTCASCEPCRAPQLIQYQGEAHDPSKAA